MPDMQHFGLDDEQRAMVRDCLKKATIKRLSDDKLDEFVRHIEQSISMFRSNETTETERETRNGLRAVYYLGKSRDPSLAQLLARMERLPKAARNYINCRAKVLIPKIFPGEVANDGFVEWAKGTKDDKYVPCLVPGWEFVEQALKDDKRGTRAAKILEAAVTVSCEGEQIVKGRSRGAGKRSGEKVEPVIMGAVRGANDQNSKGGRPRKNSQFDLVMQLALDWMGATGEKPQPGRSDEAGFGDLVHSVFQWLDLSTGEATYALRHYWAEFARHGGYRT